MKQENKTLASSWKKGLYSSAVLVALTGVITPSVINLATSVQAATKLPAGASQVGSIGSTPVIQTKNNDFNTMQPLFDALTGGVKSDFIVGDTHDGKGGQGIGWNSKTSYKGTSIANADSLIRGNSGLSANTIRYGLGKKDGFQDGDKFNYVGKGGHIGIHNVGTAYDVKAKKNIPVGLKVTIEDAHYFDSRASQTPRNVFKDGFRLLVAARGNGGTVTLGYMVAMDGIANPGSGQGTEGGGSGGAGGGARGSASGIPYSVRTTKTFVDERTGKELPANTLVAMKISDIDAGQAAQLGLGSSKQIAYIVSNPTNLHIANGALTAKGMGTVVTDNKKLNPDSYLALFKSSTTGLRFVDTFGNKGQGSIVQALFGNTGSTAPRIPYKPSIDIEKSDTNTPKAGQGNNKDKDNNVGSEDRDTVKDALNVTGKANTAIKFRFTNNGTEALKALHVSDKTIEGKVDVKAIAWTFNGQKLTVNAKGQLTLPNGKELVLQPKEFVTGEGVLPKLSGGATHGDEVNIEGVGVNSGKKVTDKDKWYGKTLKPSIDIEKADTNTPTAGQGNNTDKDNNVGSEDRDTVKEALDVTGKKQTPIKFRFTNNGEEALKSLHVTDKTIDGKVDVKNITWIFKGQKLTVNAKGQLTLPNGKELTIQPKETVTGEGILPKLSTGATHSDVVNVEGIGVKSGEKVSDKDKWYGKTLKPSIDIEKADTNTPKAGQGNNTDKDNNVGLDDRDTTKEALNVTGKDKTPIKFRFTNNGTETLTKLQVADKTTLGKVDVKDITWTFKGQKLTADKDGNLVLPNGKLLTLKPQETVTGEGILPKLPLGSYHGDTVNVEGVGVKSGEKVSDKDKWYGKTFKPSIDIEKADTNLPKAGQGNNTDKDNNVGSEDRDTVKEALNVTGKDKTPIKFRFTNNGTETLTKLHVTDKTIDGKVDVKAIAWTFKGQKLTADKDGNLVLPNGKLLNLKAQEFVTGEGVLPKLPLGTTHGDLVNVEGVGIQSGKKVSDKDKWYGKSLKPSIDIEKADTKLPKAGQGNNTDKDNNVGSDDRDTAKEALDVTGKANTAIKFRFTNNGTEALTDLHVADKTIEGKVDVKAITWTLKGQKLTADKDGNLVLPNGKLLNLKAQEFVTGEGVLPKLPLGTTHGDLVNIEGVGVDSGKKVSDKDKWYGKTNKPKAIVNTPQTPDEPHKNNVFNISLPKTGMKGQAILSIVGAVIAVIIAGLGTLFYRKNKRK